MGKEGIIYYRDYMKRVILITEFEVKLSRNVFSLINLSARKLLRRKQKIDEMNYKLVDLILFVETGHSMEKYMKMMTRFQVLKVDFSTTRINHCRYFCFNSYLSRL